MNIYVGNLDYELQENELKDVFSVYGDVSSVKIIKDKFTGKGKGFGFVEMPNDAQASKAIDEIDGTEVNGRSIKVDKARPPKERERRSY